MSRYLSHGQPNLVLEPYPENFFYNSDDPYADPANPPVAPEDITGYCGMKWSNVLDVESGNTKYHLKDFDDLTTLQVREFCPNSKF